MGPAYTMRNVIEKHYNNDFDNIGRPTSFVWYGRLRFTSTLTAQRQ